MSQCVPSWDIDDNTDQNPKSESMKYALRAPSNSVSSTLDVPTLDYEVAELTWKNGQLAMHGLCPRRVINKPQSADSVDTKYTWEGTRAAETLEAIVNQATLLPYHKTQTDVYGGDELVPWLATPKPAIASGGARASATMTMDALVPSFNNRAYEPPRSAGGAVGSCSGRPSGFEEQRMGGPAGSPATGHEWSSCRDQSVSGGATFGMENSRQLTIDTCERELGVKGFTSTSMGSPGNTSSGKRSTKSTSPDEHDSVCHSGPPAIVSGEKKKVKGKSSVSTKTSKAAAIHNQSERKRRDKINQRMKTLQKLVPNANKTDKASMLDEVIEYLKQLQAQINMMSRMSMPPMMMPLAMQQHQQQLQMAMMNPMGMGMGMGMGIGMPGVMDFNSTGGRHGMPPVFNPSTFMQPTMAAWDCHATQDRVPNANDPMAAFLACQSQPMTMDSYSKMVALFEHMQNQSSAHVLKN